MTTRTLAVAAIALVTTGTVFLTACGGGGGGGGDAKQPGTITGAQTGPTGTAAPSASSTAGTAPAFHLPPGLKVDIEGFRSDGSPQSAVLRDTSYAITALVEAEATGNPKSANFTRYFTGLHGAELADTVTSYRSSGLTLTGTDAYYRPTAKPTTATTATVSFCEDQRKAYDKNLKSGKVDVTSPSLRDFKLWRTSLTKAASGDWQVVAYSRTDGAKQCEVN